jgi:hypothetical protein
MSDSDTARETFITVKHAATRLGVPAAWLIAEAKAGRIPSLKVGKRIFVSPSLVEQSLIEQSKQAGEAQEVARA